MLSKYHRIPTQGRLSRLNLVFETFIIDPILCSCYPIIDVYGDSVQVISVFGAMVPTIQLLLDTGLSLCGSPCQEIAVWDEKTLTHDFRALEDVSCNDKVLLQKGVENNFPDNYIFPYRGLTRKMFHTIPLVLNRYHAQLLAYIKCFGKFNKCRTRLRVSLPNVSTYLHMQDICNRLDLKYTSPNQPFSLKFKCDESTHRVFDYLGLFLLESFPHFVWDAGDDVVCYFIKTYTQCCSDMNDALFEELRILMFMRFGIFIGSKSEFMKTRNPFVSSNYSMFSVKGFKQSVCNAVSVKASNKYEGELIDLELEREAIVNINGFITRI